MNDQATQKIVAALVAAFPKFTMTRDHMLMYVRALTDLPPGELARAAEALAADAQWFPTIGELRRVVIEARLQLPGAEQAWLQAETLALTKRRYEPCGPCCGVGYLGGDVDQDALCPICGGAGELEVALSALRATMTQPVLDTCRFIGLASIRETDSPQVVRAQFVKAYNRARDDAVRSASLDSLGYGELAPALGELSRGA